MTASRFSRVAIHTLRAESRTAALVSGGRFNVCAIMARAVGLARTLGSLRCWARQMSVALRRMWTVAKVEKAAAEASAARAVSAPVIARPAFVRAPIGRTWDRPIRASLHGW